MWDCAGPHVDLRKDLSGRSRIIHFFVIVDQSGFEVFRVRMSFSCSCFLTGIFMVERQGWTYTSVLEIVQKHRRTRELVWRKN